MKMTDSEQKAMIRRTASAIGCLQEGEDAISVLSKIYCQNLSDKSPRQGELMARELLAWMEIFQEAIDGAQKDPETYLYQSLKKQLAQFPLEQQCRILRRQIRGCTDLEQIKTPEDLLLTAMQPESAEDREAPAVSEAVRDSLLKEAACRIAGGAGSAALEILPEDSVAATTRSQSISRTYVGEEMLQAMTAMVVYTMAKNGELSGFPEDTSLAQVVVGVCAEDQYREILCGIQRNYLSAAEAEKRLRILRVVLFSLMFAAAAATAGSMLIAYAKQYSVVPYAALGLYIMLWLGIMMGIYYKAYAEMVQEESEAIAQIPVILNPVEKTATYHSAMPDKQENVPWTKREQQKEHQEEKTRKTQQMKS